MSLELPEETRGRAMLRDSTFLIAFFFGVLILLAVGAWLWHIWHAP